MKKPMKYELFESLPSRQDDPTFMAEVKENWNTR